VLARLGKDSFFGEIALLTAEMRSATIVVTSKKAKCLVMTKVKFDALVASTNSIQSEHRRLIGKRSLDGVKAFDNMSHHQKSELLKAMTSLNYSPNSYICRQGAVGNNFFIITEGSCKITINSTEKVEQEVGNLVPGDCFGEVAMLDAAHRRTANVVAVDFVHCLTLNRAEFNRLCENMRMGPDGRLVQDGNHGKAVHGAHAHGARGGGVHDTKLQVKLAHNSHLAKKRRVSSFDVYGHKDDNRTASLLRR
jgi:CRP-like cAMP-binding protein